MGHNYTKKKKVQLPTQEYIFRFFNNSKEYFCAVSISINIPKYRVKEIFDRTFVGKKTQDFNEISNPFLVLDENASYLITPVKGE